jgi:hypothetical protein
MPKKLTKNSTKKPGAVQKKAKDRIVYQIEESKAGSAFQAVCPELDITGFGDTVEQARESLRTQVSGYVEDCDEMGILDEVLIEAGFYFTGELWMSNEVEPAKEPKIIIL